MPDYTTLKYQMQKKINARGSTDFLEYECGIRVNSPDTGSITGSDSMGGPTKTLETILPEAADPRAYPIDVKESSYTFTTKGLTVTTENSTYENSQYSPATTCAIYNWWLDESLDLIQNSLGINFVDGRAHTNKMTLNTKNGSYWYPSISYDLGRAASIEIEVPYDACTKWDEGGSRSGSSTSSYFSDKYADIKFAEYLTDAALKANISYYYELPSEIQSGIKQMVCGGDFYGASASTSDGYTIMRYIAKQAADNQPGDWIHLHTNEGTAGNSGDDNIIVVGDNAQIAFWSGNDTVYGIHDNTRILCTREITNAYYDGNDGVLSYDGGSLRILDAKNHQINLAYSDGTVFQSYPAANS